MPMPEKPWNRSTIVLAAVIFGAAAIAVLLLPPLR
jgi:hypothetical protein